MVDLCVVEAVLFSNLGIGSGVPIVVAAVFTPIGALAIR